MKNECLYPENSSSRAYTKGCRCEECVVYKRGQRNKAHQTPRQRAMKTLRSNNEHADNRGYARMDASVEDVMELQKATKCACCGSEERLHTDHCHTTGQLRGMVCRGCNKADRLGLTPYTKEVHND